MAVQTKTTDAGPVGLIPVGEYNPAATYSLLMTVLYNHDSWVCIAMTAEGDEKDISGIAPDDPTHGAENWQALTDGGRAAVAVAGQMRSEFNDWFGATASSGIRKTVSDWLASVQSAWNTWFSQTKAAWTDWLNNTKTAWTDWFNSAKSAWTSWFGADATSGVQKQWATLKADSTAATNRANDKAEYAQTQGGYAKQQGDAAALVDASLSGTVLTVKSRTGAVKSVDTKGDKGDKGDGIDYSTMTPAEKQTLTEQVAEEIAQQGGYVLYPVEESTLSPSSTFKKNAIICIDGVIYRAVRDTANLPLKFVVESSKFVVQTIYGRTAFVRAANTVNSDWAVWVDASNDIRFRQLEDRVARLETFH